MQDFSRTEIIEGQEVWFCKIPLDEEFASHLTDPAIFPPDDFLWRALAAIPSTGSTVVEDLDAPCIESCVTPEAGFEPLHVTRFMIDGQEEYVWCLGDSPIFPESLDTVSFTRAETGCPLMSMGRQVAMLINALSYHLVRFYIKESSSLPGFDPTTFTLPPWAHWCANCKASPVMEPLLPKSPDPRAGSQHRIIDVEEHNPLQPDIAIYQDPHDMEKFVDGHKRTYLATGRWRRSDIHEIRAATYPEPLDYRQASAHVIQISETLDSRDLANENPCDNDQLGLASWNQRQGQAIGRAIRRVNDLRKLTGLLEVTYFTVSELHNSLDRSVSNYLRIES